MALLAALGAVLLLAAPALAYDGWQHATATDSTCSSAAVGCHDKATPTNATCTGCHSGYKVTGTQKCWTCHKPGQSTASWRTAAGCTGTCHLAVQAQPTSKPSYSAAYAHAATVHLGASGYGKVCTDCHGVSTGSAAPGTSPHHDAVASAAPACSDCHNGTYAKAPVGHEGRSTVCTSCHTGMNIPSSADCAACHVGNPGSGGPQITYTNDLACGDARCHGKVTNHVGTPIASAPCSTCHTPHYETLGVCTKCHTDGVDAYHHGTTRARPLADCAGCHDGTIATAKQSHAGQQCVMCHAGMAVPAVPATCGQCHFAAKFGTATCTTCHSATGIMGKEQVHTAAPGGVGCTKCHTGHNADLGACGSCHGKVPESHHGRATPAPMTLVLSASPAQFVAGQTGTLRVSLATAAGAPAAGLQVLVQARGLSQSGFSDVASLTTGADGSVSLPIQPAAGAVYRGVFRGLVSGSVVQAPAIVSAQVDVARSAGLGALPAKVRVRKKVAITGSVAPSATAAGASVTLRVERRAGAGWKLVKQQALAAGPGGAFRWVWKPRKAGAYQIQASVAAGPDLLGGASPWVALKVR